MRSLILSALSSLLFLLSPAFFASPARAAVVPVPVPTRAPEIRFLTLSASTAEPIEAILDVGGVRTTEKSPNVKLSVVFERPLAVRRVQLESCSNEWSDGIEVFSFPGLGRSFVEGGKKLLDVPISTGRPVESIAMTFGRSQMLCLKSLRFLGDDQKPILILAPSSVLTKSTGVDQDRWFDSHPETQAAVETPFKLTFNEPHEFDRAIVWTGGTAQFSHALKIKGEKGWTETLPLRSSPSSQEVIFKKPFKGKEISVEAPDSGEISELRFANGPKIESVRIEGQVRDRLRKQFELAGFAEILNTKWTTADEDKWIFLFRSDGTFFVRGFNDDLKQARDYSGVGGFSMLREGKDKIRVRVNGVRFPTKLAWDGTACPFLCGTDGSFETSTSVGDSLVIEKSGEGSITIRNRSARTQRTLTFGDLKLRRASED